MKTRIIVDSTADLIPEIKARVSTVPLTVHFGQEEYIDGVTIDNKTFYEKLIESDVLPTTSQATPDAFIKEFEKARQAGESAVVITLASKFSGTYQSAMIAAADYENIYVVDGTSAAMGTGILVELAFRLLDAGMTAEETAQALEEEKKKIVVVALVDTLEYLKQGGRISKTAAFAGGLLNIKPVLSVIDGEIHLLGKARGSKMGNNLLVQEIDKAGGIDFSNWKIVLKQAVAGADGVIDASTEVAVRYGTFLATILDFLIIAFAVFLMIKTINGFHDKMKKQEEAVPAEESAPPEPSNEEKLLTEIRDLLKAQK